MSNHSQYQRESLKHASRDSVELIHALAKQSTASSSTINWGELMDSPINPFWVSNAKSVLVFTMTKSAFFYGTWKGQGFLLNRLPAKHQGLVGFSAPCFFKASGWSFGFSFGRQKRSTLALCMTSHAERALLQGVTTCGIELAGSCGSHFHGERADVIAAATSGSLETVGITNGAGSMVDLSYARVALTVDERKNEEAYGGVDASKSTVSPYDILHGKIPPPKELAPLYGQLSSIVLFQDEESVASAPSRVSASLERMTSGRNPEEHLVMPNGSVMK